MPLTININLASYTNQLGSSLESHLLLLRNNLRSIEDNSYAEKSKISESKNPISFQLNNPLEKEELCKMEINRTFINMMSSFIDLIDTLYAVIEVAKNNIIQLEGISNEKEIKEKFGSVLDAKTREIGRNQNLSTPTKIKKIANLTRETDQIVSGLLSVRRSIEHHKSIAQGNIKFVTKELTLQTTDGKIVSSLPFKGNKNQGLQVKLSSIVKTFTVNENVYLTEKQLEDVFFTVLNIIVPELTAGVTNSLNC